MPGSIAADVAPFDSFVRDFAHRWRAAWSSHEADAIVELMTEDVVYDDSSWHKTMHGHADVREYLTVFWRAFPDMIFEMPSGPFIDPRTGTAVLHWRGLGTHNGVLDPPGIAPTGRRIDCEGLDLQEYRDGRISRIWMLSDMADVMRQLGFLPPRGSDAEQALISMGRAR